MQHNSTLYDSKSLQKTAIAYLKKLPKGTNKLVSIGASGCAIASAMLAMEPIKSLLHTHYYPEGENMSARGFEKTSSGKHLCLGDKIVIVDDLIDTGASIQKVLDEINKSLGGLENGEKILAIIVGHVCAYGNSRSVPFYFDGKKIKLIKVCGV